MKKLTKGLILVLCAAVLVAGSVMGTLAWLTDTKEISNTFTVGDIRIELKENDKTEGFETKLVPGAQIPMETKVTVLTGSEECYLFVKVDNKVSGIEVTAEDTAFETIAEQMKANGWLPVSEGSDVYYYNGKVNASSGEISKMVFSYFAVRDDVNNISITSDQNMTITAYALQATAVEEMTAEEMAEAWDDNFGTN